MWYHFRNLHSPQYTTMRNKVKEQKEARLAAVACKRSRNAAIDDDDDDDDEPDDEECDRERRETIVDLLRKKYAPTDLRQTTFDQSLLDFLVMDMKPYNVVSGKGFLAMMEVSSLTLTLLNSELLSKV